MFALNWLASQTENWSLPESFLFKLNNWHVVIILARATLPSVKAASCSVALTKLAMGYTHSQMR